MTALGIPSAVSWNVMNNDPEEQASNSIQVHFILLGAKAPGGGVRNMNPPLSPTPSYGLIRPCIGKC